jgi:hypothetical protein
MTSEEIAEGVTLFVIVVAAIVAVAAIVSALYILMVYRQRHEDSLFLTRLVHRDVRVSFASAVILVYLIMALSGASFGRPWGAVVIGVPVILMMIGPVSDALLWYRERRHGDAKRLVERLNQMDRRMDRQQSTTSKEMVRTDEHQEVQDDRITELEP